ncbi:MAG: PAS domain-containing protein, partial [Sporomusaceae bacterium]|nr:PAS domain-containing protein [Sporomusaceae bacterium]
MSGTEMTGRLLDEFRRLAAASETGGCQNFALNVAGLSPQEAELASLHAQILTNCQAAAEYELQKYRLTNDAFSIAHWEMDIKEGDAAEPANQFRWSQEFRQLLGFVDENDFPNILASWSDRLHPEDKERVLNAFRAHTADRTGKTPYNLEYRLLKKNGEYGYYRALGITMRDTAGKPLKVAGALEDITKRVRQQEILEHILDTMDSYIYVSDLETDEILFVNRKMVVDFHFDEKNIKGSKCWQHIQLGQRARCPWCKKSELLKNPHLPVIWEEDNQVAGNSLYKIDRIIEWAGDRQVHLQQCIDITAMKQAQKKLVQREKMLSALNSAAIVLLSRQDESFADAMTEGINLIAEIANFDRMSVFRNSLKPDGLHLSQIYRWNKTAGGTTETLANLADMTYAELIPRWEQVLAAGECINGPVYLMPEAAALKQFGCVTVLAIPVLHSGSFWGFAFFENLREEKCFSAHEIDILRSASFMLANVVSRNAAAALLRQADKYAKLLMDANPMASRLWDKDFNLINCNEAVVKLFQLQNKQEYIDKYFTFSPPYQPDGQNSMEKARLIVQEAFVKGACAHNWMYQLADGTPFPVETTLVRVPHGDDHVVAAYSRDLREEQKMLAEIHYRDKLLDVGHHTSFILFATADDEDLEPALVKSMSLLGECVGAHQVYIAQNKVVEGKLHFTCKYAWSSDSERPAMFSGMEFPYGLDAAWDCRFFKGECLNEPVKNLSPALQKFFSLFETKSALVIPVFVQEEFWGLVGFADCERERSFVADEVFVLRSMSLMMAAAINRSEQAAKIRNTSAQLEAALADAKEANNAKSSFLAQMSHEIRTPLNAVVGLSELVLDDNQLESEATDKLEKIHASGLTILSIVNDILDISKIESGKFEIYPANYDTPSLINDIATLNIVRIGEKPITFKLVVDENLPSTLYGDDLRVKQIFSNLLSNAFKYTNAGTVEWRLSFEREGETLWLTASVQDTGIGIKPENLQKLFSDYNQVDVKTNRKVEGTGLGLAIAKRLVEMMGGSIKVESEYGQGSAFTALLPLAEGKTDAP